MRLKTKGYPGIRGSYSPGKKKMLHFQDSAFPHPLLHLNSADATRKKKKNNDNRGQWQEVIMALFRVLSFFAFKVHLTFHLIQCATPSCKKKKLKYREAE